MDEYRPYPSSQPADLDEADDSPTPNDSSSTAGMAGQALGQAAGSAYAGAQQALSSALEDEEEEEEDDDREEVEADDTDDTDEPNRRGRSGRGSRAERPAPNLEHPGGHLSGTIARLNRPRRFGFLRTEDGMEIFFHASAMENGPTAFDALRSGQAVEFDCHQDDAGRGLAATLVQVVGPPPAETPRPPRPTREERKASRAERSERSERGERGERSERSERGDRSSRGDHWRVVVLQERFDNPVHTQLERLLNERNIRPGHFTISLFDREDGAECWVAYHTGDASGSGGKR